MNKMTEFGITTRALNALCLEKSRMEGRALKPDVLFDSDRDQWEEMGAIIKSRLIEFGNPRKRLLRIPKMGGKIADEILVFCGLPELVPNSKPKKRRIEMQRDRVALLKSDLREAEARLAEMEKKYKA